MTSTIYLVSENGCPTANQAGLPAVQILSDACDFGPPSIITLTGTISVPFTLVVLDSLVLDGLEVIGTAAAPSPVPIVPDALGNWSVDVDVTALGLLACPDLVEAEVIGTNDVGSTTQAYTNGGGSSSCGTEVTDCMWTVPFVGVPAPATVNLVQDGINPSLVATYSGTAVSGTMTLTDVNDPLNVHVFDLSSTPPLVIAPGSVSVTMPIGTIPSGEYTRVLDLVDACAPPTGCTGVVGVPVCTLNPVGAGDGTFIRKYEINSNGTVAGTSQDLINYPKPAYHYEFSGPYDITTGGTPVSAIIETPGSTDVAFTVNAGGTIPALQENPAGALPGSLGLISTEAEQIAAMRQRTTDGWVLIEGNKAGQFGAISAMSQPADIELDATVSEGRWSNYGGTTTSQTDVLAFPGLVTDLPASIMGPTPVDRLVMGTAGLQGIFSLGTVPVSPASNSFVAWLDPADPNHTANGGTGRGLAYLFCRNPAAAPGFYVDLQGNTSPGLGNSLIFFEIVLTETPQLFRTRDYVGQVVGEGVSGAFPYGSAGNFSPSNVASVVTGMGLLTDDNIPAGDPTLVPTRITRPLMISAQSTEDFSQHPILDVRGTNFGVANSGSSSGEDNHVGTLGSACSVVNGFTTGGEPEHNYLDAQLFSALSGNGGSDAGYPMIGFSGGTTTLSGAWVGLGVVGTASPTNLPAGSTGIRVLSGGDIFQTVDLSAVPNDDLNNLKWERDEKLEVVVIPPIGGALGSLEVDGFKTSANTPLGTQTYYFDPADPFGTNPASPAGNLRLVQVTNIGTPGTWDWSGATQWHMGSSSGGTMPSADLYFFGWVPPAPGNIV